MVLRFLYTLLQDGGFHWANRETTRLRENQDLLTKRLQERDDERDRKEQEGAEALIDVVLLTDSFRLTLEQLSRDIGDATRAVRTAYEKALLEQQQAREALDEARENALQLSDGRRVYFTRDGTRLFDEESRVITDEAAIAEALQLHRQNPDATSYEVYVDNWAKFADANARVQQLATTLDKLDDLERRVKAGITTPEELENAREEFEDILQSLPPDARQEYDRIRTERDSDDAPAYRDAGPDYESGASLSSDFAKAHAPALPEVTSDDAQPTAETDRLPAYRSTPDY
jgi:hypothetical protein